ncbi:uncharacterized protein A4U43_C01F1620 [Asparagus officinalis]|uniref:C3H1-type domain-containing protein n=1 Tax=Asparagus officinalis TaxID=4686 RepID=A0A5P1FL75_ASPOF|nr:zinc finger CCCH domain-containing protein 3-like [Asparagus officinalis]ONK78978.1 uncharacterized protein A4U43_C01F1620 [Asparagus officinalis]
MQDHSEFQSNAVSSSSNASPENLEDAIWKLKLEENNQVGNQNPYPDRPGAPDCIYYLRTGLCGYGGNCRYNHPNYNGQGTQDRGELPERVGQPDCQYFLKTGTCKFGATCKYHHPQERYDLQPAPLNILGLPMRQDEKSCPYYMRTGSCKFGFACKFNHPPPATLGPVFSVGPSAYGSTGPYVAPPSSLPFIGGLSAWPSARPYLPSSRMQDLPAYMPVFLPSSQGTIPVQQGWATYMGHASQIPSTEVLGPTQVSNTNLHAQSSSSTVINLPERPDQPECQHYMKTGICKYGETCKYHHPKERYLESSITLGPSGLPLRPGHGICTFYSVYGSCRYGSACKFDHPVMGSYDYAMPAHFPSSQSNLPLQVTWASTPEAPSSKTSKLTDQIKKSSEKNNVEENVASDNQNEHVTVPPSTNTEASSDSSQIHSN